jgi:hypothetical protein
MLQCQDDGQHSPHRGGDRETEGGRERARERERQREREREREGGGLDVWKIETTHRLLQWFHVKLVEVNSFGNKFAVGSTPGYLSMLQDHD